jgi:16S rRNA A1518/A1519 N6-dimethyltransferase RsmA/KsgA/DIM1 with predicted DNA glycosylase/AP lyase activity
MPDPGEEALKNIVKAHFEQENDKLKQSFADIEPELSQLIKEFKSDDNRATDQLLNTIYILTTITDKKDIGEIKELLFKSLNEDS